MALTALGFARLASHRSLSAFGVVDETVVVVVVVVLLTEVVVLLTEVVVLEADWLGLNWLGKQWLCNHRSRVAKHPSLGVRFMSQEMARSTAASASMFCCCSNFLPFSCCLQQ